jgi:hypothetical protein
MNILRELRDDFKETKDSFLYCVNIDLLSFIKFTILFLSLAFISGIIYYFRFRL